MLLYLLNLACKNTKQMGGGGVQGEINNCRIPIPQYFLNSKTNPHARRRDLFVFLNMQMNLHGKPLPGVENHP